MPAILSLDDRQVPLRGNSLVIGRDAECDITLDDNIASRRHAELRARADGRWELVDLESANGTRVNSSKLDSSHILSDGDAVTIGGTLIVYLDADTAGTKTEQFINPNATASKMTITSVDEETGTKTAAKGASTATAGSASGFNAEHPEQLLGQEIDGYAIQGVLGRGAFGTVYRAHQIKMERDVAFKVIPSNDKEVAERALTEARLAGSINHAGIARVDRCGQAEGYTWYSMELIEGHTLQQLLRRDGNFSPERATMVAYRVAKAMSAATEKGIVHRDIKPANLMISLEGQVKIMDLGLAMIVDPRNGESGDGTIAGTPNYISPEQLTDRIADQRSDIYSLGCSLFHLLTGKPPYKAPNAKETLKLHINAPLPKLSDHLPDVPKPLETTIQTMMQKNPEFRQQSWDNLVTELKELREYLNETAGVSLPPSSTPKPIIIKRNLESSDEAAASSSSSRSSARRTTARRGSDPLLKMGIVLGILLVLVVIMMIVKGSMAG